jgi:hypothetical protein
MNTPAPAKPNVKIVIDELTGNVMALEAIVRALILSSPDQEYARGVAQNSLEKLRALVLSRNFSDDVLGGLASTETEVLR